jgi:hypothetical protein
MRKIKKYIVRVKLCRTGAVMSFIVFFIAMITCLIPAYYPIFIFALIDYLITILPAIYVEEFQEDSL